MAYTNVPNFNIQQYSGFNSKQGFLNRPSGLGNILFGSHWQCVNFEVCKRVSYVIAVHYLFLCCQKGS